MNKASFRFVTIKASPESKQGHLLTTIEWETTLLLFPSLASIIPTLLKY